MGAVAEYLMMPSRGAMFGVMVLMMELIVCVPGNLVIRQVNTDTTESWVIEGVATYTHGGSNPTVFHFQCTSTVNDGNGLEWSKVGGPLGASLGAITGGIELRINPPVAGSAGTYICTDSATNDQAQFKLTDDDPSALASTSSLQYYTGDTAVIEMYTSSLEPPNSDTIDWIIDGPQNTEGMFSNYKRTLTIPNLQLSDAGSYKLTISIGKGGLITSAAAITTLLVNGLPTVIDHPEDIASQEWNEVNLTCVANSNLTVTVTWHRTDDSDLPSSHAITTSTLSYVTTSTLTIEDLRTADSGSYYCNVSDGNRYNVSNSAELTVTNYLRLTSTPQDGGANVMVISEPILLLTEPGVVDCEGSGNHYWTGPDNTNISTDITAIPHQYTDMNTGFTRLNFTSVTAFPNGVYSCISSTTSQSVYITNDNPAIYSQQDEVPVEAVISNTVLRVYVTGNNPAPTSNDITWFFNDAPLPSMVEYYQLENGNKNLVISNVSSNITIGRYRAMVSTTQGSQSVYINVSYFDPPVVTIVPDPNTIYTIQEGTTLYFNCTVTSVLDVTLSWFNDSNGLPIGTSGSGLLVLANVTRYDQGEYYCEAANDGQRARETITLSVQHKPIVTLLTTSSHQEEGQSEIPSYSCIVNSNPQADVMWSFNGGPLPDGINENYGDNNGEIRISWARSVLDSDNGTYTCTATNIIGTSFAELYLTVYAKPKISTVYSTTAITQSSSSFKTSPISNDTLTCIAHGLPSPALYWVDSNVNRLSNIYTVNGCGTAIATLPLNHKNISNGSVVSCQVSNNWGNDSQSVTIVKEDIARNITTTPTVSIATGNVINVRFQLSFDNCENINIDDSFTSVLKSVIRVSVQSCDSFSDIEVLSRGCNYNNTMLMIAVSIATNTPSIVFNSLSEWISTQPAVFLNKQSFQVNSDCGLLILVDQLSPPYDEQSLLSCISEPPITQTSTTSLPHPTPTETSTVGSNPTADVASNDLMIVWISIVAVILLLLMIVVVSLVIVLYLCAKTVHKKGDTDLTSTAQPGWEHGEFVSMNTLRTNSTHFSSQDLLPSFPHRNKLQQSNSQDSSNNGVETGREGMQDNPVYSLGPDEWDQIKREMHDSVDTPPPNYQWASTHGNQPPNVRRSQDSLRSTTPIQEKLYQRGNDQDEDDENSPTYATIRSDACREQKMEVISPQENQRRSTLPSNMSNRRPPHSSQSRYVPGGAQSSSPVHYTKPIPHRPTTGRTISSPSLNLPMPYSQPVSSMGCLRNVGTTNRPIRPPPVMAVPRQLSNRSMSNPNTIQAQEGPVGRSMLKTVQESGDGKWYDGEDTSDIVTPTTQPDNIYDGEISPYAVTPSSMIIQPHPYSQPDIGSDWHLSTTTGGSSPSTIRPTQHLSHGHPPSLPTSPTVAYETIAV